MAAALLATLSRERRTSLGEPVVPDVLSRRARSGCRSCADSRAAYVVAASVEQTMSGS